MENPIIFSFFSGAGFLDLGFEHAGFNVEFVNEYYTPFLDAYKYSREKLGLEKPRYGYYNGDIIDLLSGDIKNTLHKYVKNSKNNAMVGFIGGPPCPDFSVGGKNKGEKGNNGVLTKYYVDSIMEFLPDFFVFENVKGLWNTKKHREFYDRMKKVLSSEYDMTDKLTNSIEYGVPQDRYRIFLFGIRRKYNKNIKDFPWNNCIIGSADELLRKEIWPSTEGDGRFKGRLSDWQDKLTVEYWFNKNNVVNHPNAKHHFMPRSGLSKFMSLKEGDVSKKSYKRLHRDRFSPTAAYGNNEVHVHPCLARRISAAEAMAIQSLPQDFELPPNMTLTNMFKTIGNGVPYLAAKGLAFTIKEFLRSLN